MFVFKSIIEPFGKLKGNYIDKYRVDELYTEGFMDEFQNDPWGLCARTVRNGFDPFGTYYDFHFCLYYSMNNKLIAKEKKLMNSNCISFIISDISSNLINALQKNDKMKFQHIDCILAIAKYMDTRTILYSI